MVAPATVAWRNFLRSILPDMAFMALLLFFIFRRESQNISAAPARTTARTPRARGRPAPQSDRAASRATPVRCHSSTADVEADAGERHEAAYAHGDNQHERVMHFAQAQLTGDRN